MEFGWNDTPASESEERTDPNAVLQSEIPLLDRENGEEGPRNKSPLTLPSQMESLDRIRVLLLSFSVSPFLP